MGRAKISRRFRSEHIIGCVYGEVPAGLIRWPQNRLQPGLPGGSPDRTKVALPAHPASSSDPFSDINHTGCCHYFPPAISDTVHRTADSYTGYNWVAPDFQNKKRS